VLDHPVQVVTAVEHLAFDLLDEHRQGGVGQERSVRQHAQQVDPVLGQPVAQDLGKRRMRIRVDLVDDGAHDLNTVSREERAVEHDLVNGPADASFGHDRRRRLQHARDRRVTQPDNRAYACVTGAFDEQELVTVGEGGVRLPDTAREVGRDLAPDVRLGEPARDVDRAHVAESVGQAEGRLHQDRVLVGRLAVDDRVALADRLRKTDVVTTILERGHEPQRDRRLAAVHARRGEVQLPHDLPLTKRR
jgi:hypothetical protein